ncbi:hypothetical protein AYJ57_25420 (plasmid) [Salipiger sp. CCB-MM3]|uniref:calcium-binding protein n=1 Tax=Salipiger sp. CCB-MM3 TaxID=1792508 RepID=UPI00080ABA6D|nr:hypothetical protein [Salipiger sp. CCB-MM3]ANT63817.1 hypothetical protein AYJ57_25420 [Salipiger sp. CCB-MM3]
MAVLRSYVSLDMSNDEVWYGDLLESSSARFTVSDGYRTGTYFGDFSYGEYGEISGSLTGIKEWVGSNLRFSLQDFEADAYTFFYTLADGETVDTYSYLLKGKDKVYGGSGSDVLLGFSGRDVLKGGGAGDELSGGKGNDKLSGGAGRDSLWGGRGADVLNGGQGNDILEGNAGQDTFVFGDGHGRDRIVDFQDDIDTVSLSADLWDGDLTKRQVINKFAEIKFGNMIFDFGDERLVLEDFKNMQDLRDDLLIV